MDYRLTTTVRKIRDKTGKLSTVTEQFSAYPGGEERYTYMLVWYSSAGLNARYFSSISELYYFGKTIWS